jgi:hypothetical protein
MSLIPYASFWISWIWQKKKNLFQTILPEGYNVSLHNGP